MAKKPYNAIQSLNLSLAKLSAMIAVAESVATEPETKRILKDATAAMEEASVGYGNLCNALREVQL